MTPIDEAALKAEQAEFEKWAAQFGVKPGGRTAWKMWKAWQARALLHRSQGQEPVARNNALRDDHPLSKGFCAHDVSMAKHCAACAKPPSRDTVVPAEQAEDWISLSDKVPDQFGPRLLVTNNKDARDSFGHHSHVWLTSMVHEQDDGTFCAFIDRNSTVEFLTHWRYAIPSDAAIGRNREAGGS